MQFLVTVDFDMAVGPYNMWRWFHDLMKSMHPFCTTRWYYPNCYFHSHYCSYCECVCVRSVYVLRSYSILHGIHWFYDPMNFAHRPNWIAWWAIWQHWAEVLQPHNRCQQNHWPLLSMYRWSMSMAKVAVIFLSNFALLYVARLQWTIKIRIFEKRRLNCKKSPKKLLPLTMPTKSVRRRSFVLTFSLLSFLIEFGSVTSDADCFSSSIGCDGGWSNVDFAFFGDSFACGGDDAGFLTDVGWSLLFGWSERCKMNCTSLEYSPHFIRICENFQSIKHEINLK